VKAGVPGGNNQEDPGLGVKDTYGDDPVKALKNKFDKAKKDEE